MATPDNNPTSPEYETTYEQARVTVDVVYEEIIHEMSAQLIAQAELETVRASRPFRMLRFMIKSFLGDIQVREVGNHFLGHNVKEWTAVQDSNFDVRG